MNVRETPSCMQGRESLPACALATAEAAAS